MPKVLPYDFAIFILASCGKNTDDSMFQTSESAVNAYRTYLSDMRSMETLSTEHLIEAVNGLAGTSGFSLCPYRQRHGRPYPRKV